MQRVIATVLCAGLIACVQPESTAALERAVIAPPEAAAWIEATHIPLTTVEFGNGFADLAPLAATIGDARVVGLGEATHGSRELFQLKHRLIEYLVTQQGFTVLAFESTFGETLDIEDYVINGRGDPARALAGQGGWPWTTEEVLALVEWMREYNRTAAHEVHFLGVDMQLPDRSLRDVLGYLRRVDPAAAAHYAASLHMATTRYDFYSLDVPDIEAMLAEATALLARFDARQAVYTARSSAASWRRHRQHARVVRQAIEGLLLDFTVDSIAANNFRDAAMADNTEWILAEHPGAKVMLWAHNAHVTRKNRFPDWIALGAHLDARLGDDYRPIALAFDEGEFQALSATSRLQAFTIGSGGPEHLDGALAAHAAPISILPLGDIPAGPVADYFATLPRTRSISASYLDAGPQAYLFPEQVTIGYDALAFVATTTRARPLSYSNDLITPIATNPAPLDLGFEAGTSGWNWPVVNDVTGYTLTTTHAFPHQGAKSAVLARDLRRAYGRGYGELRQRIAAAAYAGKRVRLRAAIRSVLAPGARIHMYMRAGGAYDGMHDRPIATSSLAWRTHDIVLNIPASASNIQLGFILVGDGVAGIDAVSLEILPPASP